VVAHQTAATPALLQAIRDRAARGAAAFHLLVPSAAAQADGEQVLTLALPMITAAAGTPAGGSVSTRHDPVDAVEETLAAGRFDEVIVSTLPRSVSNWLHVDVPRRIAHLGLPVTTVVAEERAAPAPA
jgi:hypothetical protein